MKKAAFQTRFSLDKFNIFCSHKYNPAFSVQTLPAISTKAFHSPAKIKISFSTTKIPREKNQLKRRVDFKDLKFFKIDRIVMLTLVFH